MRRAARGERVGRGEEGRSRRRVGVEEVEEDGAAVLVLTDKGCIFLGSRDAIVCQEGEWCVLPRPAALLLAGSSGDE